MTTRRNFIRSAAGILIAAPMVVRAGSIMPVRVVPDWRVGVIQDAARRYTFHPYTLYCDSPGTTDDWLDRADLLSRYYREILND